jgi:thioredoxin 2
MSSASSRPSNSADSPRLHVACSHCVAVNRLPAERRRDDPSCARCGKALLDGSVVVLNEAHFDTLVGKTELPVLVDFWAPWCGPCLAMAPQLAKAAQTLKGEVLVAKFNSDESLALAQRYQLRTIPTLVLFAGGRERRRHSGSLTAGDIVSFARR